jgi:hypothetical protein
MAAAQPIPLQEQFSVLLPQGIETGYLLLYCDKELYGGSFRKAKSSEGTLQKFRTGTTPRDIAEILAEDSPRTPIVCDIAVGKFLAKDLQRAGAKNLYLLDLGRRQIYLYVTAIHNQE